MTKTIFLVIVLFMGMVAFDDKDNTEKKVIPPKEQIRVEQHQKDAAKSLILSLLPPQEEWPSPVQKVYLAFTLEDTIEPMRAKQGWVKLENIPKHMQQALLAIEDHKFYEHDGVSPESILRAMLVNITDGEVSQGGSTLTQQFVKNTFLNNEQTMERKVEEAILSVMLEDKYSKDEILEMYLNTTYFGAGATGIAQASKIYFGKIPAKLSLSEAAILAALPYAPTALNPLKNADVCKQRQILVLNAMQKYGYITKEKVDAVKTEAVYLTNRTFMQKRI